MQANAPSLDGPGPTQGSKRSQTVSLVLLVGVGAAALVLARRDPSQREEDTLVYADLAACRAQGLRSPEDCEAADREVRALYPTVAPRYPDSAACERHHGSGGCTAAVAPAPAGAFVPLLAGFMIGRSADQHLPVQPLFRHAPDEAREAAGVSGVSGGYCTSGGGRVWTARGSTLARVSSAVARGGPAPARVVATGGFGATGHGVAVHASSGHAGSGHAGG
ncbi:hypothetical protein OPKNFCMD_0644 [Methylobacterium crusticola]|uniref:DUF1190 domain-containing protein n=1 Tax=Methylobacterium crusticola TaxID=1697972 RepID=A0ABQ4QTC4_9HYPH|nr:DUF1190 domain-containing protein [Methylobacterium crusticola]GJD47931.1 hypothetical protein OPKNFCMD_0644 [Methylobacterium crusticola]